MWIVLLLCTPLLTESVNSFTYVKHGVQHYPDKNSTEAVKMLMHSRGNCTPSAIEQFPRPFMTREERIHGGLIFHFFISFYSLAALIIICNNYLVPSLQCISKEFRITPDVAAATILVAGESAPELVTIIISVLFTKDDIGMSNVIGSAVYNYLFITSACVLFTKNICQLNWWPLFRDGLFYLITLIVLICFISNEQICWFKSIVLLSMYFLYCVIMYYNTALEKCATNCLLKLGAKKKWLPAIENIQLNDHFSEMEATTEKNMQADPKEPQEKTSKIKICLWYFLSPIYITLKYTIPCCTTKKWERYYLVTFFMSILWICIFSYIILWMIVIIGYTLGIPDSVMGLTLVAAAAATPDLVASFTIFRQGHGNMAFSNAVGSNIFDILICLGLPWFIQTTIINPGSQINIYSAGLYYSLIGLLIYFIFSTALIFINRGKLNKTLGMTLMILYFTFIILASLLELNIFGNLNPEECPSSY